VAALALDRDAIERAVADFAAGKRAGDIRDERAAIGWVKRRGNAGDGVELFVG
jgi:hypothetical protein